MRILPCRSVAVHLSTEDRADVDLLGVSIRSAIAVRRQEERSSNMAVHYLEIVSNDVDTLTGLYQRMHGLSFGPPDADLGQARVATRADGTLVGIRKPLAAHEQPIMRSYLAVEDIQQAVKKAEEHGATVAYPPTQQGQRGTFAIVIQGDVQHGLWQR
jgi:predicted enzyme related to lactoylglutathione lyase